jgi:gluconolactonase
VDLLQGRHHNQPTDLVVDGKGRVWFCDPLNPTPAYGPPIFPFLDHQSILRLERDNRRAWTLTRITYDTQEPRTLQLSADEKTLYVADGDTDRGEPSELRAYPVNEDGRVGQYKVLHAFAAGQRGFEGLCLADAGNIIACGGWKQNGPGPMVYVFSPSGTVLEMHPVPADLPMRCAFGDDSLTSLYLTTGEGHLYRAKNTGCRGVRR